jgi:hypothetical protein
LSCGGGGVLAPAVRAVYAYGGFVGTFTGDGFTAIFSLSGGAARAVACALEIQRALAARAVEHTPYGDFALSARITLAHGPVHWGLLGRGARRAYFFRGAPVRAAAEAQVDAEPGEVLAAWPLVEFLGPRLRTVPRHGLWRVTGVDAPPPQARRAPTPLVRDDLAPFLPDAVIDLDAPGEFREVCVAFVAFDEPRHVAALDAFVSLALELAAPGDARQRFAVLRARERVYDLLGARAAQDRDLQALAELAASLDAVSASREGAHQAEALALEAESALFMGNVEALLERHTEALAWYEETVRLARLAGDRRNEARALLPLTNARWRCAARWGRPVGSPRRARARRRSRWRAATCPRRARWSTRSWTSRAGTRCLRSPRRRGATWCAIACCARRATRAPGRCWHRRAGCSRGSRPGSTATRGGGSTRTCRRIANWREGRSVPPRLADHEDWPVEVLA